MTSSFHEAVRFHHLCEDDQRIQISSHQITPCRQKSTAYLSSSESNAGLRSQRE
jgi:hypothetical protein